MKANEIIDAIWKLWTYSCGIGVLVLLLCIAVFGGDFHIHFTFETLTELLNHK